MLPNATACPFCGQTLGTTIEVAPAIRRVRLGTTTIRIALPVMATLLVGVVPTGCTRDSDGTSDSIADEGASVAAYANSSDDWDTNDTLFTTTSVSTSGTDTDTGTTDTGSETDTGTAGETSSGTDSSSGTDTGPRSDTETSTGIDTTSDGVDSR